MMGVGWVAKWGLGGKTPFLSVTLEDSPGVRATPPPFQWRSCEWGLLVVGGACGRQWPCWSSCADDQVAAWGKFTPALRH